jgi:hypothetical protein
MLHMGWRCCNGIFFFLMEHCHLYRKLFGINIAIKLCIFCTRCHYNIYAAELLHLTVLLVSPCICNVSHRIGVKKYGIAAL